MNEMTLTLLVITVQLMVPLAWASLGEIVSERAGVLNVGLEGAILIGALGAAVGYSNTDSLAVGALAGLASGLVLGAVLSYLYVWKAVDQVVGGVMIFLLASGFSTAMWAKLQGPYSGQTLPRLPIPLLSEIPVIGEVLFDQDAFVFATLLLAPLLYFFLRDARWGKYVRATGEAPEAVDAAGLSVRHIRAVALTLGTMLGAMGGVALVLASSSGRFVANMSGGIGFIALGIVLLVRWNPLWALIAAAAFSFLQGLRYVAQSSPALDAIPVEAILALPYLVAIVVVTISRGSRYPAAMGTFWKGGG